MHLRHRASSWNTTAPVRASVPQGRPGAGEPWLVALRPRQPIEKGGIVSDGFRRTARRGQQGRGSGRKRLLVAGALGLVGFVVIYFFDPEQGPERRRRARGAFENVAWEALRLSNQLADRLAEPVAETPPVRPRVSPEPADLAKALHDEVSIFHPEPEPEEQPVPVGVGGPAEERFETEPPPRSSSDRVNYVHSVTAPATPRPTIISYDAAGAADRVVSDVEATTTKPSTGSRWRRVLVSTLAVLVLLGAAALGAWAIWGGDDGTKVAAGPLTPSGAAQALELMSQPGARSVSVANSKGAMVLVVTPGGRAALIVSGLEKAPPGKEYQAWVVTKSGPHSAGLFKGGSTRLVIPLGRKLPKGSIFAVTVERAGGVPAPTQKPRFAATIA